MARPKDRQQRKAGKALRSGARVKVPKTSKPVPRREPVPVIGIGASAGGLEAIEQLLGSITFPCGKAFVIVQHLDPNRAGALVELLQRIVPVPVREARHRMLVQADQIYVIPPGKNIALKDRCLELSKPVERRGMRLPIDFFFKSLAVQQRGASMGVILSGMGSDGTDGLRAIMAAGGRTFTQLPETAQFDGMPTSALAAGIVGTVGTPIELSVDILRPASKQRRKQAGLKNGYTPGETDAIDRILGSVLAQTGHDFSSYKSSIIRRRIDRRMDATRVPSLARYASVVAREPSEAALLAQSFLIGVTAFFRDPDFWDYLASTTLPALLRALPAQQILRGWIPGCATGEEAYSYAMLLAEAQDQFPASTRQDVRLFATDLDPDAIDFARQGLFEPTSCESIPRERVDRWFTEEQGRYRIRPRIREMLVFAAHDVAADPPFTKLDFLSCRNLMIYMDAELQRRLLDKFHYSLNPSGYLLLGNSEAVPLDDRSFLQLQPQHKIFQRVATRVGTRFVSPAASPKGAGIPRRTVTHRPKETDLTSAAALALIEHFSPAAVVVSAEGELMQVLGSVGKYLEPGAGKASLNIFGMARTGIRGALSEAMRAVTSGRVGKASRLGNVLKGARSVSRVTVKRLGASGPLRGLFMIAFDDPGVEMPQRSGVAASRAHTRSVRRLEIEMEELRQENSNSAQELMAANEELQAMNEELQSANEELMTSKEETQSMNEELQTVNAELQSKLNTFTVVNNDLRNLLDSTDIATIFLDGNLRIRRFTRHMARLFRLIPGDVGRPLTDVHSDLIDSQLLPDVTQVLATLMVTEKEIAASDDRWYLARIMPYRASDNVIDGVVITFADISAAKQLERKLRGVDLR